MNDAAHVRVDEARILLEVLGFDQERSNERSALVLLALAHLTATDRWSTATAPMVGTRAIMDWIRDEYETDYAPNTRETIRRFTLHQFVAAGLVVENPDEPGRPVNSPKWCYQLRPEALRLIHANETPQFGDDLAVCRAILPGLAAQYASERAMARIPVTLPDGSEVALLRILLSVTSHNAQVLDTNCVGDRGLVRRRSDAPHPLQRRTVPRAV